MKEQRSPRKGFKPLMGAVGVENKAGLLTLFLSKKKEKI